MSQSRIRQLLESRLKAWADARSPALRVAWENVDFTPADEETYLQAFLLPAPTVSGDLKGDHRSYTGIFQISVIVPKGNGAGAGEGVANEIATLFPVNLRLSIASPEFEVMVLTPMSIGAAQSEPDKYLLPVSAQYRADTI